MSEVTKIPIYEAQVLVQGETGIQAISFVECPAINVNFVALQAEARRVQLSLNKPKQILTGPVLIPNQAIFRSDTQLGEYYIRYSAQSIEAISQKMMHKGVSLQSTSHQHAKPLEGNYLVEMWIVKDPKCDKAAAMGLGELPAGTLMASYKVESAKYWREEVLTGKVKGFSLEGSFNFNQIKMATQTKPAAKPATKVPSAFKAALAKMLGVNLESETPAEAEAVAAVATADETSSAEVLLIFTLADGSTCQVDAEGFATLEGEQMAAGEHALDDGNVIVIDDAGQLVVTQPEGEGTEPAEAAAALAKERGKAYLAARTKTATSAAKFAELERQLKRVQTDLALFKRQPSASPAAAADANGGNPSGDLSFEARLGKALRGRMGGAKQSK